MTVVQLSESFSKGFREMFSTHRVVLPSLPRMVFRFEIYTHLMSTRLYLSIMPDISHQTHSKDRCFFRNAFSVQHHCLPLLTVFGIGSGEMSNVCLH